MAIRRFLTNLYGEFRGSVIVFLRVFVRMFEGQTFLFLAFVCMLASYLFCGVCVSCGFTIFAGQRIGQYSLLTMRFDRLFCCFAMTSVVCIRVYSGSRSQGFVFLAWIPYLLYSGLGTYFAKGCGSHYVYYTCYFFCFTCRVRVSKDVRRVSLCLVP